MYRAISRRPGSVEVETLALNGNTYPVETFSVMDSGGGPTTFPAATYQGLTQALANDANFVSVLGASFFGSTTTCVTLAAGATAATLNAQLPPLEIVIQGFDDPSNPGRNKNVSLQLNASNSYVRLKYSATAGLQACPGIKISSDGKTGLFTLPIMRQFITVFDSVNNQIGFAPEQGCNAIVSRLLQP